MLFTNVCNSTCKKELGTLRTWYIFLNVDVCYKTWEINFCTEGSQTKRSGYFCACCWSHGATFSMSFMILYTCVRWFIMLFKFWYQNVCKLAFSPISVWSPAGSMVKSGRRAQVSRTVLYRVLSIFIPKRMLSSTVAFRIQACCGTYATVPWNKMYIS